MSRPTIILPTTDNRILFEDLKIGEIFKYGDDIFVKTDAMLGADEVTTINCVNITTGFLGFFHLDDSVQNVKAEIKIFYE